MRTRRSPAERQAILEAWKDSDLTQQAFADEYNLNVGTLRNWIYKRRDEMLNLPGSVRIFLAAGPTDMRKGFDGLSALVQQFREDVYSGHLFVFVSRRRDRVKILTWDGCARNPLVGLPYRESEYDHHGQDDNYGDQRPSLLKPSTRAFRSGVGAYQYSDIFVTTHRRFGLTLPPDTGRFAKQEVRSPHAPLETSSLHPSVQSRGCLSNGDKVSSRSRGTLAH